MQDEGRGDYQDYDGSPHQRKPDLVLEGEGGGKRRWVELKSWRYQTKYLTKNGKKLYAEYFPLWDGESRGNDVKRYTTKAHKQAFLDYAATRNALQEDYWEEQSFSEFKPNKHTTWIQVWKPGVREWRELKRENGRYTLGKKKVTINVATPWLDKDDMTNGVVTGISPQFRALQRYLSSAPKMRAEAFKDSIGYALSEHEKEHVEKQVTENVTDLATTTIRPFTLSTFFALEAGESAGRQLKQEIYDEFGDSELAELQKAIDSNTLTEEQVEALRQEITDKALEIIGPLKYLAVDIPLLSDLENAVVDLFTGDEIDELRKYAAEFELPEDYFEVACEAP